MTIKTFFGIVLLTGCFALFSHASVVEEKKSESKSLIDTIHSGISKCTNRTVSFIKQHPFITATITVALMSKKMRSILMKLPRDLWYDAQKYPITMALLGGFMLSYLVI